MDLQAVRVDLDNPKEFTHLIGLMKANKLAQEMNNTFIEVMSQRGKKLTEQEKFFSLANFHFMSYEAPYRTPIVSAGYTGFGKTTMMITFVETMSQLRPETFGCVIAVEKITQINELEKALNKNGKIAFGLKGSQLFTDKAKYRSQFDEQAKFPVLILTHAMLEVITKTSKLHEIDFWYNYTGAKQRRVQLLIDEKPKLLNNVVITPDRLNRFVDLVRGINQRKHGSDFEGYYLRVRHLADQLNEVLTALRGKSDAKTFLVEPVDPSYSVSSELLADWISSVDDKDKDLLPAFQEVIKRGGTANVFESGTSVIVAVKGAYDLSYMNTIIFDGTSSDSRDYKLIEKNAMFPLVARQATENVTFKIYNKLELSKEKLKDLNTFYSSVKLAKEVAKQHKQTLVIVFSDYYNKYHEALKDEIDSGAVSLVYFNSLTATNEFAKCDAILPLGTFRKRESFYFENTRLIYGKVKTFEVVKRPTIFFKDENTHSYLMGDLIETLKQAVGRLRPYNADEMKTVYLITRYPEVVEAFQKDFVGARFEVWNPPVELGGETSKERLIDWLLEFANEPVGTKVKTSYVYKEALKISREQWKNLKKDKDITLLMEELKISFSGYHIEKN
jgi:hypothetical protein